MNEYDSEIVKAILQSSGYEFSNSVEQADIILINTCSVRAKPERKVYSMIGRLARHQKRNPRAFCAVGGCVAQHAGQDFLDRFPFVRLVFGTDQTEEACDALERMADDPDLRLRVARVPVLVLLQVVVERWSALADEPGAARPHQ